MIVSLCGSVVVLLACVLSWKISGTCFTPWFLVVAAQVGGVSIYYLGLHLLFSDLQPMTWAILAGFVFCFLSGCFVMSRLVPASNGMPVGSDVVQEGLLSAILPVLVALVLFGLLLGHHRAGGWPMFLKEKDLARMAFAGIPWYGSFAFQAITATGFYGFLFAMDGNRRRKIAGWVCVALVFWVGLAVGMRGYLIFFSVLALAAWDARRNPISPVKLFLAVAVILSVFLAVFLFRFRTVAFTSLADHLPIQEKLRLIVTPLYVYFANNFWNLDSALQKLATSQELIASPGYWTLGGLFYFTHVPGALNIAYGFSDQYRTLLKTPDLNTMPIEWYLYADWGWFGVTFGAFALGCFATYFFRRRRSSVFHLAVHAAFSLCLAMSFFAFLFGLPDAVLLLFVAISAKVGTQIHDRMRAAG